MLIEDEKRSQTDEECTLKTCSTKEGRIGRNYRRTKQSCLIIMRKQKQGSHLPKKSKIQNPKSSKAPGENTITAELLKNADKECQLRIYNLILKIWQSETMPEKWKKGLIVPIHKKGSRSECANYRPITLLNVTYKLLSTIDSRNTRRNAYLTTSVASDRTDLQQIISLLSDKVWRSESGVWHRSVYVACGL